MNGTFKGASGNECNGTACPKEKLIRINKNHKNVIETLTHELAHAYIFETDHVANTEMNANLLGLFVEDCLHGITILNEKNWRSTTQKRKVKPKAQKKK